MTIKPILTLFILAGLIISCSNEESVDYAIPAVYFVEFDYQSSEIPEDLITKTKSILVSSDYVLTEESGREGWPFYLSLPKGTKFPKDSLAPPHTTIHILRCDEEVKMQEKGQTFAVNASFDNITSKSFDLKVEIWKMDSLGNLKRSANPPAYTIVADFSQNLDSLSQKVAGTITRATFK